jgi:hypothetical protein
MGFASGHLMGARRSRTNAADRLPSWGLPRQALRDRLLTLCFQGQAAEKPITTQDDVSRWVDSIFNASVPLYAARHTGVLQPPAAASAGGATPQVEGGVHHYPTPITDIQLFKHDDFQLWVVDSQGQPAAVTPAGPRGSGDGRINVAYATPGAQLHAQWMRAHLADQHLTLAPDHPMARQAFAAQTGAPAAPASGGP